MPKLKQIPNSVAFFIVLAPFLGAGIGSIGGAVRNDDPGGLGLTLGFFVGIGAMFISLILGPIVGFLTKNNQNKRFSYMGYISPLIIGLIWLLYATI